jgi:hypothetical protein
MIAGVHWRVKSLPLAYLDILGEAIKASNSSVTFPLSTAPGAFGGCRVCNLEGSYIMARNKFYLVALLAAFWFGTSARGMADEDICVHGHSAQSQTPHSAPVYFGWGITLAPPSHDGNWLHYSIPTPSGKSLKAIKVKFSTGEDGYIDAIHLWDGDVPKLRLEHLELKGAERKVIPISPEQAISSVGISIRVKAGPGALARLGSSIFGGSEKARVQISSVCGTFVAGQVSDPVSHHPE